EGGRNSSASRRISSGPVKRASTATENLMSWFTQPSRRSGFRPQVESLEGRTLLSNFLVVDFNPDRIPGELKRAEPSTRPFGRRIDGHTPRFLDFNHDGRVSAADVAPAVKQILLDTAAYLAGFDVVVVPGDVGRNTNLGQRLLHLGDVTDNPTYVVYLGVLDFAVSAAEHRLRIFPRAFGASFQAPVGFNLQYYALAYFTTMVVWYQANRPGATPEQFAQDAARTVVHEFGHLLGLGDTLQGPVTGADNSIMSRFV